MIFGTQATYAERRARVSGNVLTITDASDVTKTYLNEGVREFAKKVNGIPKEDYLTLAPKFDARTNFAIRLTITSGANALSATDVPITDADITDAAGATMASALKGALSNNAAVSCSVSWSTTEWKFCVTSEDSNTTYMEVSEPTGITYIDARNLLFNTEGTQASAFWIGDIPQDSTLETDLPTNYLSMQQVEWDGDPLSPAPYDLFMSPQSAGTPIWYNVKKKKIRIAPCPEEQKLFHIRYKHMPDDLKTDGTADATECPLPTDFHWAPVYYSAAMLAQENDDDSIYRREMAMFIDQVNRYRIQENNQTPTLFPQGTPFKVPRVDI